MNDALNTKTANELASGAPGTITLGGQAYLVAQPGQNEMTTIALEARKIAKRKRNDKLLELFREFKDYELAKKILADTMPGADDDAANIQDALTDVEGCQWIAFVLLKKLQPTITMADIRQLITADTAPVVGIELLLESGLGRAVPNSPGASGSP
jgi:soluble cytochrome b562